jgi:raffinose/stachyose/melibiose transport system substrate-binding protein
MKGQKFTKMLRVFLVVALAVYCMSVAFAADKVTLSVGLLAEDLDFFQAHINDASFKKMLPNVNIDFQQSKDTEEMSRIERVRMAANEIPDVFYVKPYDILPLKDSMALWAPTEKLVKENKFVDTFAVNINNGKYYGLPMKTFYEWVYYRKSVFKELNLTVPATWDQFIAVAKKIKANGKYIPIALGAKDTWPTYPFNEFMPHLISGDPNILADVAKQDKPFGPDGGFYKSYTMIDTLYKAGVFGDPLGTSWPEQEQLMAAKKAAMTCVGQYFLPDYKKMGGDMNDIAVFPLPVGSAARPIKKQMAMLDLFWAVGKNSKHPAEAQKFIEWFFSPSIYKAYLTDRFMSSTIKGIDAANIFSEGLKKYNYQPFLYVPGDENYTKLVNETKFDAKTIGSQMLAGMSYKDLLADFNQKWADARKKLGIK